MQKQSLLTTNPELASEWHPTKNGQLTPADVTAGSQKKVWWKCPKGSDHEWDARILDRHYGAGCAVCSNYKVVYSNCLATLNPELSKEWHPTQNGNLTPFDVHPGSAKRVWWKCPQGDDHEWRALVYSRDGGRGCPICSGRQVVKSNSLAILNPELAKEWHPTQNGKLTPLDVTPGSGRKVWWKCYKGEDHEWKAAITNRNNGLSCPICSNQRVITSNCLAILNPDLAKEWHPTQNGNLTPYDVVPGSGKVVWWKCLKGDDHEWRGSVKKRHEGRGCPICIGRKVVRSNSLATINPALTKEWHPTKNGNLLPHSVRPGSQKKVWWRCLKRPDHIWKASISERNYGTGCPICNDSSSVPELRIYSEIKRIFPTTQHRAILHGHEVDIYIPDLHFGIEYDGSYWHRDKLEKDQQKTAALESHILLVRVREKGLRKISDTDIALGTTSVSVSVVKKILRLILKTRHIHDSDVLGKIHEYLKSKRWIASAYFNKLLAERRTLDFEKSLGYVFPELSKEWHPTKNDPLLPEHFIPGSHKEVWWKCELGHEWEAEIYSRSNGGKQCPICVVKNFYKHDSLAEEKPDLAKEWHPTKNGALSPYDVACCSMKKVWWKCPKGDDHEWQAAVAKRYNGRGCPICANYKVVKSNCLASLNPLIAEEWHPTKNGNVTPHDVTPESHMKVWWKCPEGGDHEWQTEVRSRKRTGCPICSGRKVVKSNCLATLNPDLAKEWHPTKNGNITPHLVTPGSRKKVWWLASCGHEWQATIFHRTNGRDCPNCRYKKASKTRRRRREEGQLKLF